MNHLIIKYYKLTNKNDILSFFTTIKYLIVHKKNYEIFKDMQDNDNEISLKYYEKNTNDISHEKMTINCKKDIDYNQLILLDKIINAIKQEL